MQLAQLTAGNCHRYVPRAVEKRAARMPILVCCDREHGKRGPAFVSFVEKHVTQLRQTWRVQASRVLSAVTPRAEGDAADCLLMSASVAVLIWLSMQLYRVYAYSYYMAGLERF